MKIIKIKLAFYCTILLTFIHACNPDDILNRPKITTQVPSEVIFSSVESVNHNFAGNYRYLRYASPIADGHDCFGLFSVYFSRTAKGNDFIFGWLSWPWFRDDYTYLGRKPDDRRTGFNWAFFYELINYANIIINGVNKSPELAEEDKEKLTAHARALRAFFYFQLAIDYQSTYIEDSSKPSLPIYTTPNNTESKPFSTLKEVYDLIKEDLQFAVDHLDNSRPGKTFINKAVAEGIYARVLLVTQDNWPLCEQLAHDAYGGTPENVLSPEQYTDGFDDMSAKEWIWAMYQQDDQSAYYTMAPHSFVDPDGYGSFYINRRFIDTFSDTDVRNLFEENPSDKIPSYKKFRTTKFTFSFTCDAPIMRTPEMILIEAEAKFWQGDNTGAANLLYALQKNRDAKAVASGNTGEDLFNEILLERRKELYGEIGVEFFDLKRLRRPMKRDANHRSIVNLEKDDKRYYLKILQKEIDANPNITEAINKDR